MATRYAAASMASLLLLPLLIGAAAAAAVDDAAADSTSYRRLNHVGKHGDIHHPPSHQLSIASASSPPPPTTRSSFALAVEGVVHCQHCKHVGTNSLLEATRFAGAKVRLACRNKLSKTFVYKTAYTNTHGYFNFRVEEYYKFRLHGGVQSCIVYLVSSPSQSCYKTTDINSGRIGANLTRQKVYPDVIVYNVGPFSFAPTSCNVPSSYFKLPKARYRFSPSSWPSF